MDSNYVHGQWNFVCFECGRRRKSGQARKHWKGYFVCESCWEPRHPQDFIGSVPRETPPPWTQPEPAPIFIDPNFTPQVDPPPDPIPPPVESPPDPPPVIPPPPDTANYLTDENGDFLTDENGNYITLE